MSTSTKSPASVSPRDARMENRNKRRDSAEGLWEYPEARDFQDLNKDAAARNLPFALREVADAAKETAVAKNLSKLGGGV